MSDMRKNVLLLTFLGLILMSCSTLPGTRGSKEALSKPEAKLITNVGISTTSFNPKSGEELGIYYTLTHGAKVTVKVFDPDWGLIRTLCQDAAKEPGQIQEIWDGKDIDGTVVPNEAYFFTIEAAGSSGEKEVYDPTTFSGGEEDKITKGDLNDETGTLTYDMPEMGRVLIRAGVKEGALLNALVDWEPRLAGKVTEYWNGKDKDNLLDLRHHSLFKLIIVYFTLPENSVITYGNNDTDFRGYKLKIADSRYQKEDRPRLTKPTRPISLHYRLSRVWDREPMISFEFPQNQKTSPEGLPIVKGMELVRVALDKDYAQFLANQQYEISFFLDTEYYAEEETGYSPFNWVWDFSEVSAGEHVLTINMAGLKDQIGVLSRKVIVEK